MYALFRAGIRFLYIHYNTDLETFCNTIATDFAILFTCRKYFEDIFMSIVAVVARRVGDNSSVRQVDCSLKNKTQKKNEVSDSIFHLKLCVLSSFLVAYPAYTEITIFLYL